VKEFEHTELEFWSYGEIVKTNHVLFINDQGVVILSSMSEVDNRVFILIPWHKVEKLTYHENDKSLTLQKLENDR